MTETYFSLNLCGHTWFHKLEMTQEAAQNIRRYYMNTYKYGAGASTICKTDFIFKQNPLNFDPGTRECLCPFFRPGSGRFWRLGVQPRHQIFLHIWAPGPRALRLPVTTFSHIPCLQWSSARGQDHCSQSYRENTSSNGPSHDLSSFVNVL